MEHTANTGGHSAKNGGKPTKKKRKFSFARLIGRIFLCIFTLCVIGILTVGIFMKIFMTYVDTTLIPSLTEINIEDLTMSLASKVYYNDRKTGEWKVLDTLHNADANRELVDYDQIPKHLKDAIVAVEDKRFWEHEGVDWKGTIRATIYSLTGQKTQGGSTITQQMLRNTTGDNEPTINRKLREIFRALEFEKRNSKDDILNVYLNYIYFGAGAHGVQTAAQTYFGKNVQELDLAESAAIVGITNNPSLYNPLSHKEFVQSDGSIKTPRDFNKKRQEMILDLMYEQEKISAAERDAAKAEKLLFTDTPEYQELHANDPDKIVDTSKPNTWFVDTVIEDAITLIAESQDCTRKIATSLLFSAGYQIYTTIDPDIQAVVDKVYTDSSNFNYPSKKGTPLNSAITIVDPYTGDVVAMAGGVGEKEGSRTLNLATTRRPCGSAIKPVSVYAPAIDADLIGPGSIIDDYPISLNDSGKGGYPRNSHGTYQGPMSVAYALQQSVNTVAARTLQMLGYSTSFDFMEQKLGFDLDSNDLGVGPLAMGGLTYGVTTEEMAAAFGAFANSGIYTKPRTISKILSNDGTEVIVDNSSCSNVAMKESTAYVMNKMLKSVIFGGTGGGAAFNGMTIAGKTGTTNNNFDRYFVGYSPYYSAAVWVGYSGSPEKIQARGNPAAKIWKTVMQEIHQGLENKPFPADPGGMVTVQLCADCGKLAGPLCALDYRGSRVVTAELPKDAVPTETCDCHIEVRVCTDPLTGEVHLAGDYCPDSTCSTRVMLKGREFLFTEGGDTPDGIGSPILSEDAEAHLSYLQTLGTCPVHDSAYHEDLVPGDPGWQWPDWEWHWPWEKNDEDNTETPANPDDHSGTPPDEPHDISPNLPVEPDEPVIPPEPQLPPQ